MLRDNLSVSLTLFIWSVNLDTSDPENLPWLPLGKVHFLSNSVNLSKSSSTSTLIYITIWIKHHQSPHICSGRSGNVFMEEATFEVTLERKVRIRGRSWGDYTNSVHFHVPWPEGSIEVSTWHFGLPLVASRQENQHTPNLRFLYHILLSG